MIIEELDVELMEWLSGTNLEHKQHEAMQLLTVSEDQWPHQAMISMGEVIAISPRQLRLALWQGTQTSMNMSKTGKATLIAVQGHRLLHIRIEVELLPEMRGLFIREIVLKRRCSKYVWITRHMRRSLQE